MKIKNPYKFQVLEVFRKPGDKLVRSLGGLENVVKQLEFGNGGKTLIIRDFDKLVREGSSPDHT